MKQDEEGLAMPSARAASPSGLSRSASSCQHGIAIAGTLEDAIAWAAKLHEGQVDKAGQPYILHPLRVMSKMETEAHRIAAVLHDTVEDCGVSLGAVEATFGREIGAAVDALSRREGETYTDFIARCGRNKLATIVKLADLRDNMDLGRLGRKPTPADKRRAHKYAQAKKQLRAAQAIETRSDETATPVRSEG
jgi:(p)ppGpp synthase/HD superfamily hydrolase